MLFSSFSLALMVATANAGSRNGLRQRETTSDDKVFDCIPKQCSSLGFNTEVICQEESQYCQNGDDGMSIGSPCRNETAAPEYPISEACDDILNPYDPDKIEENCGRTGFCLSAAWGRPALWVMCNVQSGRGGPSMHFTGMECPEDEGDEDESDVDDTTEGDD